MTIIGGAPDDDPPLGGSRGDLISELRGSDVGSPRRVTADCRTQAARDGAPRVHR